MAGDRWREPANQQERPDQRDGGEEKQRGRDGDESVRQRWIEHGAAKQSAQARERERSRAPGRSACPPCRLRNGTRAAPQSRWIDPALAIDASRSSDHADHALRAQLPGGPVRRAGSSSVAARLAQSRGRQGSRRAATAIRSDDDPPRSAPNRHRRDGQQLERDEHDAASNAIDADPEGRREQASDERVWTPEIPAVR